MNLYVSRNGQTFGPYTFEQAKHFLDSKQLLSTDLALVEGTEQWKLLPDLLSEISPSRGASVGHTDNLEDRTESEQSFVEQKPEAKLVKKKQSKKPQSNLQKIQRTKGGTIIIAAQEKSFIAKIFSTIFVFVFLFLIAVGLVVGAYFAMPSKMGPILSRFGIKMVLLLLYKK